MIDVTFRPLDLARWPGERTAARDRTQNFTGSWSSTLQMLDVELSALRATRVVVEIDVAERAIRNDGWPKADARPKDPGVVLSFESPFGPLRYSCDRFDGGRFRGYSRDADGQPGRVLDRLPGWQCNLRAIALGLEALRKVERYGIASRGEQYTGWRALPGGTAMPASQAMTLDDAALILIREADWLDVDVTRDGLLAGDEELVSRAYRAASKRTHPDQCAECDGAVFRAVQAARDTLLGSRA